MVLHPHVMHKAQAEIDAVVGRNRLPRASDRDKLPYVRALMREVRSSTCQAKLTSLNLLDECIGDQMEINRYVLARFPKSSRTFC